MSSNSNINTENMTFKEAFKHSYDQKKKERIEKLSKSLKKTNFIPFSYYTFMKERCMDKCITTMDQKLLDEQEIKCLNECSSHFSEINVEFNENNAFSNFVPKE